MAEIDRNYTRTMCELECRHLFKDAIQLDPEPLNFTKNSKNITSTERIKYFQVKFTTVSKCQAKK